MTTEMLQRGASGGRRAEASSRWIMTQPAASTPRRRLFCLPFAGGGASSYRGWGRWLPSDLELCALQLPGREARFGEPLLRDMEAMVEGTLQAVAPLRDLPFAFFGHSMGAVIAYETARRLAELGGPQPGLLAVSGRAAPFLTGKMPPMHELDDAAFVEGLRRLEGTPAEVLENAELMELILPVLRADFRAIETYRWREGPPLRAPLLVLGGESDPDTDPASLQAWAEVTQGGCRSELLPGGHFFLNEQRERVLALLREELDTLDSLHRGFAR